MTMTTDGLRAAASTFLARAGDVVAWDERHCRHALGLLERFSAGALDAEALRAALGDGPARARPASAPKTTAVLALTGVLTPADSFFSLFGLGTSVRGFLAELAAAVADPAVRSIVIVCDSPGGLVGMIPEAAAALHQATERKRVIVSVAGLNASAAYWLTSNASRIESTPSGLIGAIGIFGVRPSIVRRLEQDGVDVEVFSAGRYKTEGLEVTAITAAERQATQARVDETYTVFVEDVARGRRVSATSVRGGFGEGRIVSAATALRLGMIDRIATVEDTIARVAAAPEAQATLQAKRDATTRAMLAPQRARQTAVALAGYRRALAAVTDRVGHT
jgi:signal peptide peptidase SppA